MNHLAHCFLSLNDEDLLLGNFIGDFVKGHNWQHYPPAVQKGILLHRSIDSFTDRHAMTDRSVNRIRPFAGRYAPPFLDILYDHLLAVSWARYSGELFDNFAERTYTQLEKRASDMPPVLRERLPKMIAGKFLHGYTSRQGLEWVLERFSTRLNGHFDAGALSDFFFDEMPAFLDDFYVFFPDLMKNVKEFVEFGADLPSDRHSL